MTIFHRSPEELMPVDDEVSSNDHVYLVAYDDVVMEAEHTIGKKFSIFPFSNFPAINLFSNAEEYVSSHIDIWRELAIENSKHRIKQVYNGRAI
jgi:hypothetical protein